MQNNRQNLQQKILPMFRHAVRHLEENQMRGQAERWLDEVGTRLERDNERIDQGRHMTAVERAEMTEWLGRIVKEMRDARAGLLSSGFLDMEGFDFYAENFQECSRCTDWCKPRKKSQPQRSS